jgi:hypothetical protein
MNPDGETAPDNAADNDVASIALPAVPAPGAEKFNAKTTVSAMLPSHAEAAGLLSPSPL